MPAIIFAAPGPVLITDGTNVAAVKAASTPAAAGDKALVVSLSPNSPTPAPPSLPLPTGAATEATLASVKTDTDQLDVALSTRASQTTVASIALATASIATETDVALSTRASESTLSTRAADATLTGGTQRTKVTDGTNDAAVKTASTAAVATDKALVVSLSPNSPAKVSDGTNTAAVKAASTAPVATDPALVVAISPNTPALASDTSSTATVTSVAGSASSVQLLASTAGRKMATFYNESTATLFLKLGTTASNTSYTVQIPPSGYYELPRPTYTGRIDGIWASAAGNVRITELT